MTSPPDPHHRHRFPAGIISYAVWLYYVFSLSLRDVELILAKRGVSSFPTRRCDAGARFAAGFADRLRGRKPFATMTYGPLGGSIAHASNRASGI
jgi:putative transposase